MQLLKQCATCFLFLHANPFLISKLINYNSKKKKQFGAVMTIKLSHSLRPTGHLAGFKDPTKIILNQFNMYTILYI